jgi:alkyl sulfatase BDS1-like metallo-beta-lactamase superfamily hydrolase
LTQTSPSQLLGRWREAPERLGDGFAAAMRRLPGQRLDQFMATPLRRIVLDTIFWQMPRYLDSGRARGVEATVRWQVTARGGRTVDTYELTVADGRARSRRGARAAEPRVTITVDGARFLQIAAGAADPMQAYFKGDLAIAGDIMAAAKLVSLFRMPGATSRRLTRLSAS